MAGLEEPILSRLTRLDNILKQLEDIKSSSVNGGGQYYSPKSTSSYASTTSTSSDPFIDFSPATTLEKHCRPIDEVLLEVERKGTLIQRLVHAEDRILKMCLQLEEEFEAEREKEQSTPPLSSIDKKKSSSSSSSTPPKKGLKQLVKSCVPGKNHKHNKNTTTTTTTHV